MRGRRTAFYAGTTTPIYTRHTGLPPSYHYHYVHTPFARVSVPCSGFELVDDPGHVDDFHGKFPYPDGELRIAPQKNRPTFGDRSPARPAISVQTARICRD